MTEPFAAARHDWQAEKRCAVVVAIPLPAYCQAFARIFRPSRSVMTSARVASRPWRLVFEPRSPPVIDHRWAIAAAVKYLPKCSWIFPVWTQRSPSLRSRDWTTSCALIRPNDLEQTFETLSEKRLPTTPPCNIKGEK